MLRTGQAIRMGLRAATRNPELAFGRALLDLAGSILSSLPVLFAAVLLWRAFAGEQSLRGLLHALEAIKRLGWPLAGALFAAAVISWALSAGFWAGALPVLAVDAEMGARPPAGTFFRLAFAGFARVAGASAITSALSLLISLCLTAALLLAVPLTFAKPSLPLLASLAALLTCSLLTGLIIDLLGNLALIRSAAFGDDGASAFIRAAQLFGERIGGVVAIAAVFFLGELMIATALGTLFGPVLADAPLTFEAQFLSIAPRLALSIVSAVAFAWLELARQGAFAALAADAEGLIELPPEPAPRAPTQPRRTVQAWELRPPPIAVQPSTPEHIIEALPIAEEPVIEALPMPDPTGAPHEKGDS